VHRSAYGWIPIPVVRIKNGASAAIACFIWRRYGRLGKYAVNDHA